MIKRILNLFVIGLISFILLEVSIYCLAHFGGLNIILPTYSMGSSEDFLPERSMIYGHRHQPNSTYEVKKNCLHTFYQFNSLGFRDKVHPKKSNKKRVVVIGDSFMEGVGVKENERLPNLIQKATGIEHLNFAMADKGSTQAFLIYDSIASKYQHDAVLFSVFPVNDFIDDDPEIGKNENSIRPCWIGEFPNYTLQFVPKTAPQYKESSIWKHFLKTHTYTYDALFYLKESMKEKMGSRANYSKTGYFDYTKEQLNRIKFSLLKIKKKTGDKALIVLCIPSHLDLQNKKPVEQSVEQNLASFCAKNNIEFIGMWDPLTSNSSNPVSDYYYSCDSHWNKNGHLIAKEALINTQFYRSLVN